MFLQNLVVFQIFSLVCADFINFNSLYPQLKELIRGSKLYQSPVNNNEYWTATEPTIDEILNFGTFDFIIIGGGAAGGVLANRLTEENFTVLVIEAGSKTPDISAVLGVSTYLYNSKYNWGFNTTSQDNACFASPNNQCDFPRGKVLGGSSSINAGMYIRGNAEDFNKWENLGNPGWSYRQVLPYFKKSEYANFSKDIDKSYHGFNGLQSIGLGQDTPTYTKTILDGFSELGFKELDYNGESQIGYGRLQFYKTFNVRSSTNYSFIRPVVNRPNLHILLNSLVTKIRITKNTADGVEFIKNGQKYYANATKEVLLSAGAVSSPQVLMLSGIGPEKHLKELEIDVIANLPVGQNFQDHIKFFVSFTVQQPHKTYSSAEATHLWLNDERPWNVGFDAEVLNFFSFENSSVPDIELVTTGPLRTILGNISIGSIYVVLLNPLSMGEVTLSSKNAKDLPLVNPNYLAHIMDVEYLYKGIQKVLDLLNTTSLQNYHANVTIATIEECNGKNKILSKDWWICQLRHSASTAFHPTGSTRMGNSSKTSVVDSELKVHGIKKLRVVDAGIIPAPTTGHTNAPTVMIAEKIGDIIKNKHINT